MRKAIVLLAGLGLGLAAAAAERLRFKEKHCVFDSVIVPTSLVYPIQDIA